MVGRTYARLDCVRKQIVTQSCVSASDLGMRAVQPPPFQSAQIRRFMPAPQAISAFRGTPRSWDSGRFCCLSNSVNVVLFRQIRSRRLANEHPIDRVRGFAFWQLFVAMGPPPSVLVRFRLDAAAAEWAESGGWLKILASDY